MTWSPETKITLSSVTSGASLAPRGHLCPKISEPHSHKETVSSRVLVEMAPPPSAGAAPVKAIPRDTAEDVPHTVSSPVMWPPSHSTVAGLRLSFPWCHRQRRCLAL